MSPEVPSRSSSDFNDAGGWRTIMPISLQRCQERDELVMPYHQLIHPSQNPGARVNSSSAPMMRGVKSTPYAEAACLQMSGSNSISCLAKQPDKLAQFIAKA